MTINNKWQKNKYTLYDDTILDYFVKSEREKEEIRKNCFERQTKENTSVRILEEYKAT
jgi:hypothetical protein